MVHTVHAARFDIDDLVHRFGTLTMMLAAAMAVQVPMALDGDAGFAAAYTGTRVVLLLLYLRARRNIPEARAVTSLYLAGFGALTCGDSRFGPGLESQKYKERKGIVCTPYS